MKKPIVATSDQRRASNPENSVWVMANAGSGKTHVLIDRVIRLMLSGADPQSIMCLTYTKAAAAEMSNRLFDKLSAWVGLDDQELTLNLTNIGASLSDENTLALARQLFARAIETPGGLKIQTIHAFCEKVLHLFPVESGLAPGFRVMDEDQKSDLLQQAMKAMLNEAVAENNFELLDFFENSKLQDRDQFIEYAGSFLGSTSVFHRMLHKDLPLDAIDVVLREKLSLPIGQTTENYLNAYATLDRAFFKDVARQLQTIKKPAAGVTTTISNLQKIANEPDISSIAATLQDWFFTLEGKIGKPHLYVKSTTESHPDICLWLDELQASQVALLQRHALSQKVDATISFIMVMREVARHFEALKQSRALYDFDDLIMRMGELVNSRREAQWVLYKLDSGLSHILVDESQDTSPAQWDIIKRLTDEFFAGDGVQQNQARTMFAVGDIKQSIYSFQGANTEVFQEVRKHFSTTSDQSGVPFEDVKLTVSYRSVQSVLDLVDTVFAATSPAALGLGDAKEESLHSTTRLDVPGLIEFWPLFQPTDEAEIESWTAAVDHKPQNAPINRLAKYVAEQVQSWIGKRQLTGSVPPRAIEAKDVLVLLQKRGPLFTALIAAFRKLGVPVSGADRLVLNKSLAVQDVLALLQVLVMPDDDLALAAVLKSPLVPNPVSEHGLYDLAHDRVGSLWQNLIAQSPPHHNALALLSDAEFSGAHGPYDVIARVLARSRKAMVERLGVEALDATDILLDQAMEFEAQEGRSIAGFIHWFSKSEASVKRELDQEQNQVRLMTVHGAKGLEANIVIMPDAHLAAASRGTSLLQSPQATTSELTFPLLNIATDVQVDLLKSWKDHSKLLNVAEKKRLLYVAMTRARDELYIGGIKPGSAQQDRKLDDDSWYTLVSDALAHAGEHMDLHECDSGHPEGNVLRHGQDPIWIAAIQQKDEHAKVDLPTWLTTPFQSEPLPVSQKFTGRDGIEDAAERAALLRGQAIHKFLERLKTGDSAAVLAARAKRLGLDGALAQHLGALAEAAETAQLFSAAAESEVNIAGLLPNGQKIERRIDRLLVTKSHIYVLDFKSERNPPQQVPARYVTQVTEYVAVLREAYPDRVVRSAILWTETGRLDWLNIP